MPKKKQSYQPIPTHRFAMPGSTKACSKRKGKDQPPCHDKSLHAVTQEKFDACAKGSTDCFSPIAVAQSGIRTKTVTKTKGGKVISKTKSLEINPDIGCTKTMAKRDKCRLQLGFDQGQAFLRACFRGTGQGYRIDVKDPQDAHKKAKKICAEWKTNGKNWGFLKQRGLPLGAAGPKKSKVIVIEGEAWTVERRPFWSPNRGGGRTDVAWEFVRVSDGRPLTSETKERGIEVIARRIRDGVLTPWDRSTGRPLKGTLAMKDEQGFDLAEVRRIANLISYGFSVEEIRSKAPDQSDHEFFLTYKAAERYLKQNQG
jgi:hypothetical protein